MKPILAIASLALLLNACQSSTSAPKTTSYYCGTYQNAPATIAKTPRGDRPIVRWVSEHFSQSGWSPQQRCQEVSDRLQVFYDSGLLRAITHGKINGQKAICVAKSKSSGCSGLLITLEPKDDPKQVLKELLDPSTLSVERSSSSNPDESYFELDKDLASPDR